MLLSSLALLLLPVISAAVKNPTTTKCLPSGNEKPINEAFRTGGTGTTVTLCPGSVHRLNSSIVFTSERQTITTEGNPKGRERALLIVEGANVATAIKADCQQCSYAMIRSLEIDGNRPIMLRIVKGDALIEVGNAESQTVRDCKLYEPRGWSALHFREGDRKQCRLGHIVDNEIGPAGEEWDPDYDGNDEKDPPYGNPRADGISLACKDSLVERNVVYDTTDGAIVLFGSAGSEVRNNHIYSRTRVVLGGINLVDYDPWQGDYMSVTVHHNHLHAFGRYFKVGIVIGPSSWSDDTDSIVHSASVTDNTFEGDHFGYGVVVSSATSFTVLRNTVDENAKFRGIRGPTCPKAPENGKPTAFLINRGSARGMFQDEFVNGEVQHIICIDMPDEDGQPYKPWRLRDSPEAIAAKAASDAADPNNPAIQAAFDARVAEALVSYQMAMITAMDTINHKIERLTNPVSDADFLPPPHEYEQGQITGGPGGGGGSSKKKTSSGNRDVDELNNKLEELEKGGKRLKKQLDGVRVEFEGLSNRLKKSADDNKPVIESVFLSVQSILSGNTALSSTKQRLFGTRGGDGDPEGHDSVFNHVPFGIFGVVLGSGALFLAATSLVKRWRGKTAQGRKGFR
ncbi:hypothetical protein CI109_102909 [Kwoniella shandongensis]|uniref:Right handed beta helix domain-containing protein n=1 Tax=Kwoniella shandongensis TaxID=1734106 RepID=A0A5M6C7Y9_9TREE|nr:uncharacterized protein CI109_000097 [Kwoniella shandongensis]KAA5531257.1 hypothetical protein CI109_000097 [Kwoniella shandongensis]